jgi:hypothetical protein
MGPVVISPVGEQELVAAMEFFLQVTQESQENLDELDEELGDDRETFYEVAPCLSLVTTHPSLPVFERSRSPPRFTSLTNTEGHRPYGWCPSRVSTGL